MSSVIQAQLDADDRRRAPAFDKKTESRIRACADQPKACPVRAPEYQDLTGDGKDDLIVGIEAEDHTVSIWVYKLKDGVVNRILNTAGTPLAVDVTEGKLIMREPTETPGYEIRTVFGWNPHSQVMEMQATEYDWQPPSSTASPGRKP
ncbi:FG-GAP repeat protein [Streptomyces albospinus]|uniref:FG-GAP repeat protein n=1 Tax=Streptomyces albospinus TaxID=285515 RepID=UPI001E328F38|nr:FG-GAP repeat protein [Streptomyces albospinus]